MKNKKILLYIIIILLVSLVIGFIFGINHKIELTDYINSLSLKNNCFLFHSLILFLFFIFTISLIGPLFGTLYLSFEGMSIGYILSLFIMHYKIKGVLYFIYVLLINKIFFLIISIYLFYISFNYFKIGINNLLNYNKDTFSNIVKPLLKKYFVIIVFSLFYDAFLYFFGNTILHLLIK